jgi:hypothetical protein
LYISVLTLGEIRNGITRLRDRVRHARLEAFLSALPSRFQRRILPIDAAIAEEWGQLMGELAAAGTPPPLIDALIGATALHHGLALVTRNDKDFRLPGLSVINPYSRE